LSGIVNSGRETTMVTFAITALVMIMMPGPDQALITRNALVGGRRGGLLTMVGGVLGVTVHASAAALGLSALLMASATAFTVLKLAGAVYLLWLAVQMLISARRTRQTPAVDGDAVAPARRLAYLRQGFLSNALNPKVALFFVTFLPQFLSADVRALSLSGIFAALYLCWFGVYAVAVDRLGRWLQRPRVKARIEQLTGLILAAIAIRLATAV
jgi:threonine/homoserine/homoserine lactone efflux protein